MLFLCRKSWVHYIDKIVMIGHTCQITRKMFNALRTTLENALKSFMRKENSQDSCQSINSSVFRIWIFNIGVWFGVSLFDDELSYYSGTM